MGRDAYSTALYVVDSDIEKVGGKGAFVGMDREGPEGKQYVLVQSYDISVNFSNGKLILAFKGGQTFEVTLASNTGRCSGLPADGVTSVSAGKYFWMQTRGIATNLITSGVTDGTSVGSLGSGVGGSLTLINTITHVAASDADYTLTRTGSIGWAIGNEVSAKSTVYIRPDYEWTGTGTPLSITTPDGS